jgi:hypothetical protein
MISFLDTQQPSWMESIPFAPEIQNILDLVYFQISQNQNSRVSLPEVSNSILPTDQKELVSLAAFKGAK